MGEEDEEEEGDLGLGPAAIFADAFRSDGERKTDLARATAAMDRVDSEKADEQNHKP